MKNAILALLFCSACASGQAHEGWPNRGAWAIEIAKPGQAPTVAQFCGIELTSCELVARDSNQAREETGLAPIYFVAWVEE